MSSVSHPTSYPFTNTTSRLEIIPNRIDVEEESRLYDDMVFVRLQALENYPQNLTVLSALLDPYSGWDESPTDTRPPQRSYCERKCHLREMKLVVYNLSHEEYGFCVRGEDRRLEECDVGELCRSAQLESQAREYNSLPSFYATPSYKFH